MPGHSRRSRAPSARPDVGAAGPAPGRRVPIIGATVAQPVSLIEWLPAVIVPPLLVCDAAVSAYGKPITAVSVVSAFVACLPLVIRRRISYVVLIPLLVLGILLALWQLNPAATVVFIPMIALFELALSGERRRTAWMAVVVVPCVFISVIPFAHPGNLASIVVANVALCLLALAAGEAGRSRRLSAQRDSDVREQATLRRIGEERLRIAREIHDVVAHAMTAINVQAGVAAHLLERDPGQAYGALRDIKRTSGDALGELRHTLDVLRDPAAAAPLGPAASLEDLEPLTGGLRSAGVAVELDVATLGDVPAAVQSAGYRIVQEALTNVARHAHASRARVSIRRADGMLTIEVVDDGASAAPTLSVGNGVRGMRERAAALGGTLDAAPARAGGWQVRARLPVAS
jgi:signal transduction histidine kinase